MWALLSAARERGQRESATTNDAAPLHGAAADLQARGGGVCCPRARGDPRRASGVATILAITLPVAETGTDPTELPFAALFAPLAAALLTALAGVIAGVFRRGPDTR